MPSYELEFSSKAPPCQPTLLPQTSDTSVATFLSEAISLKMVSDSDSSESNSDSSDDSGTTSSSLDDDDGSEYSSSESEDGLENYKIAQKEVNLGLKFCGWVFFLQ